MLDSDTLTVSRAVAERQPAEDVAPAIAVRDLSYAYPNGHPALRGVSLMIQPGERVALMGPNGAGKSTLLMHLNGIIRGQGRIEVTGLPLDDDTVRQIRAIVGFVFQNPDDQLFSPTVYDDVAYGPLYMGMPKDEIRRRVREALAAVDMAGFEDRMPHHLSLGQRKRVSVATVLSMDPRILVLDEPTAGLDPRARKGLIALLRDLPQTLIASTHDMRLVRDLFDRAVIMQEGRIVVDAPTADIIDNESLLEQYGLELP
ncbi:MAG TPA: ABC transporter ATP-binding protein [Thermomicrobiales bacterium]|nr:ABC transporter ATP-binding protein [Thermomicrobiales bacterium]